MRANATALHQHTGDALLTPEAHPVLFRTGQLRTGQRLGDSVPCNASATLAK
jgi:hypothetical protein